MLSVPKRDRLAALTLGATIALSCTANPELLPPEEDAPGDADVSLSDAGVSQDALAPLEAGPTPADAGPPVVFSAADKALIAARPYKLVVPKSYVANKAAPLVIALHGYQGSGSSIDKYFNLSNTAELFGFVLALPTGTKDKSGATFWNATPACCNVNNLPVDDVAYLTAIMNQVQTSYSIDPKRVFFLGHSNGGFMSYRMACERSSRIAGIASLAGADFKNVADCKATGPVAVLQVHGDQDTTIKYNGGTFAGQAVFPSAKESVSHWAARNGCSSTLTPEGGPIDLETVLAGAETKVEQHAGCASASAVELWTIQGGSHIPKVGTNFGALLFQFLSASPKP